MSGCDGGCCGRRDPSWSSVARSQRYGSDDTQGGRHVTECARTPSRERATSGARRAHVTQYTTFFSCRIIRRTLPDDFFLLNAPFPIIFRRIPRHTHTHACVSTIIGRVFFSGRTCTASNLPFPFFV